MADAVSQMQVIVTANTAEAEGALGTLEATLGGLKTVIAGLGITLGAAALVGFAKSSFDAAVQFQSAMTLIQTQAGATSEEVKKMSQSILNMAATLGETPQALAEALFPIESAGYRDSKAIDILTNSIKLSKVGHADLTQTANVLTSVLMSGVGGINSTTDAVGQMNAIVGAGKMHLGDLEAAIATGILPTLRAAGISFTQYGAAIDVFTNAGVPAVDASARLRMSIGLMVTQSGPFTKAVESMGMAQNQLAKDMQSGGLLKAIEDLHDHLQGLSKTAQENILGKMFGSRESATMMSLIQNVDEFQKKIKDVSATSGQFGEALRKAEGDTQFSIDQMKGQFNTLKVVIGGALMDAFNGFVVLLETKIIPTIMAVTKFIGQQHQFFQLLGNIIQSTLLPLLNQLRAIWQEHHDLYLKVIQIILVMAAAIIGTLIVAILTLIGTIALIVTALLKLGDIIMNLVQGALTILSNTIKLVGNGFSTLGSIVNSVMNSIKSDVENAVNFVVGKLHDLMNALGNAKNAVGGVLSGHIPGFASGVTNFSGGLALVGEQGPELVHLPQGSSVINNSQTKNILNNSQAQPINIHINNPTVRNDNDISAIAQAVSRVLGRQAELAKLGAI